LENENVAQTHAGHHHSRKPEYIAAIIANAVILLIVNQILNWGFLPFLTQDFKQVIPIQNVSLAATIIFNVAFLFHDTDRFSSPLKMMLNAIGVAVLLRYLSVFPFDFSGSSFNWAVLFRVMIVIGIMGCAIAVIVEAIKFILALMHRK